MVHRNQFFVGVITGVLVSMMILGVFHMRNSPTDMQSSSQTGNFVTRQQVTGDCQHFLGWLQLVDRFSVPISVWCNSLNRVCS